MTPGPFVLLVGALLHAAWCVAMLPVRAMQWLIRRGG